LFVIVCVAALVARSVEPRSIYDAKLTDEQIAERQRLRDITAQEVWPKQQTEQS